MGAAQGLPLSLIKHGLKETAQFWVEIRWDRLVLFSAWGRCSSGDLVQDCSGVTKNDPHLWQTQHSSAKPTVPTAAAALG